MQILLGYEASMIQIQGSIDRKIYIACSGGVDSMAVVDFLSRNHSVHILFFDHGTQTSHDAKEFLLDTFELSSRDPNKFDLSIGNLSRVKNSDESWEEYWRNQRYEWFHSYNVPIITCHHLDDCVETWIWSSLHGEGKIIPYTNQNVIRPFRLNKKSEFTNWARRNGVTWIEDETNEDTKYMRNFIRKELMDKCLIVNPGLHKVIRKKILEDANI